MTTVNHDYDQNVDESVFGTPRSAPAATAREAVDEMVEAGLFDDLMDRIDEGGLRLTGEDGFLPEMIKRVLERGLGNELSDHLGYDKHERTGTGGGNARNGSMSKTVRTEVGQVALDTPRDRQGSFEPKLVPKGAREIGGLDEMIISLYAGGMTVRDIGHHLERTYGTELSHETISNITDGVAEEVTAWQSRPLEEIYPIIYLDALVVKVRDGHQVRNRSAHIAVGVDLDGIKHVLGIWVQASEGAKFWAGVCAELANRGVKDVLIVCCDGLTGLAEAIEATWPKATVQTCVVHLIRAAMRFVSYNDRKKVATALRPISPPPLRGGRCPHRPDRRGRRDRATDLRRIRHGPQIPGLGRRVRERLGAVHPVSGLPRTGAQGHLHHQHDRVAELPTTQDHQKPRTLPQRPSRDQAALAGHLRHRRQTRPSPTKGTRHPEEQAQSRRTPRRRRHHTRMESRPRRPRPGLPRAPHQPPQLNREPKLHPQKT